MSSFSNTKAPAIVADQFREAVLKSIESARGTYIYDAVVRDLKDKTAPGDPAGYATWLDGLLGYCAGELGIANPRILDLGCGTGEFTTIINLLGHDAIGADISENSLVLARILAKENRIPESRFHKIDGRTLPFDADSFDVVLMISALEHIDDDTLTWLVPELRRVCAGILFVQVPSSMKVTDDHTGLKFVPWLPHPIAAAYIALRGKRYRYLVSQSKEWDVFHRSLDHIERLFASNFEMQFVPSQHSFPRCTEQDAVLSLRKRIRIGPLAFTLRVPLLVRYLRKAMGKRIEYFYPYYNLAFRRRG